MMVVMVGFKAEGNFLFSSPEKAEALSLFDIIIITVQWVCYGQINIAVIWGFDYFRRYAFSPLSIDVWIT